MVVVVVGGGWCSGARWQQWHVSATWPGEYEPFSLLLFSQCEMTLARFVGPVWLAAPQSVRPSVWPSVTLTAKSVSRRVSPLAGSSVGPRAAENYKVWARWRALVLNT